MEVLFVVIFLAGIVASSDRWKRETCHAKFQAIPNHSACLVASSLSRNAGVSSSEQATILGEHNKYRSQVSPAATNMMKMIWDTELAMVAQKYAEACKINTHDGNRQRGIPGRFSAGQNLASGDYDVGWTNVVKLWYDEVIDFKTSGGNNLQQVGHYTQVVWADSIYLGCGFAECGNTRNYVCNYAPAGNIGSIDNPYIRGSTACSVCPGSCTNNLCDCGGTVCLNGGTLDRSTCQCSCKQYSFYQGNNCYLNCTGQTDPNTCTFYTQSQCAQFVNVPQDCPSMCNVCPYAGIAFNAMTSSTSSITSAEMTSVQSNTTPPPPYTTNDAGAEGSSTPPSKACCHVSQRIYVIILMAIIMAVLT